MNHSDSSDCEMPSYNSHIKLRRDDSYVRKQTTIGANKIILELPESSFLEDEKILGNVLLKLQSKLNAKRITLQIIGELNYIIRESFNSSGQQNAKNLNLNKVMDSYKKSTSLAGIKRQRTVLGRQAYAYSNFAGMKNPDSAANSFLSEKKMLPSPTNHTLLDKKDLTLSTAATASLNRAPSSLNRAPSVKKSTTLNRSVTRSNTKIHPMTRQATQATTEVFCHYLIPIFQFKKHLQPEVEEDPDEDSFNEEDENLSEDGNKRVVEKKQNLKCVASLNVFWNYKKHIGESDFYTENEIQKELTFTIPRALCCFLKSQIVAEIWMPKTILNPNDIVSFSLKIHGPLKPKNVNIRIDLVEEISNSLINFRDASLMPLSISYQKHYENWVITFSGDIDLGSSASANSLRSDDWNISHILELYISTQTFLSKHEEKYMVPILIIPQIHEIKKKNEVTPRELKFLKEIDNEKDKPLLLTYSKFKLEDRYDIVRNQNFSNPVEIDME